MNCYCNNFDVIYFISIYFLHGKEEIDEIFKAFQSGCLLQLFYGHIINYFSWQLGCLDKSGRHFTLYSQFIIFLVSLHLLNKYFSLKAHGLEFLIKCRQITFYISIIASLLMQSYPKKIIENTNKQNEENKNTKSKLRDNQC